MSFNLLFTEQAIKDLTNLEKDSSLAKRLKAVRKSLAYLQSNPRHPSLNTHKYHSIYGMNGEEIFEAYAENNTPAAYRIFWHYGKGKDVITIITITSHP
jgi:mRNA-degrading endonuclease RelE of RelBE toxin-antitoxin system